MLIRNFYIATSCNEICINVETENHDYRSIFIEKIVFPGYFTVELNQMKKSSTENWLCQFCLSKSIYAICFEPQHDVNVYLYR